MTIQLTEKIDKGSSKSLSNLQISNENQSKPISLKNENIGLGITKIILENSYTIKDIGLSTDQAVLLILLFLANPYSTELIEEKEKLINIATKSEIFGKKLQTFIEYILHLAWDSMMYLISYSALFEEAEVNEILKNKDSKKFRKTHIYFGKMIKEIAPGYSIDNFGFGFIYSFILDDIPRGMLSH